MKSKSWSGRFVRACAASSLLAAAAAAQGPPKAPIIALLDPAEAEQWRAWSASRGYRVVAAASAPDKPLDARIADLQAAVKTALDQGSADPARVYLAARGDAASAVFYTGSRLPDRWAAAVAIGGSPQPAIDTNRFYAANFSNFPTLWVTSAPEDEKAAAKLRDAGMKLEWRAAQGLGANAVLDWLETKRRDEFPAAVDCETSSPAFASCFWIRATKFDPASRNDVVGSTRLQPRSGAALDLGGFGYHTADPGPGILVNWLPEKYSGPLKLNDRIVSLSGRTLKDAREYAEMMEKTVEEKAVVATVQRGKDRVRLETRIVLPKREEVFTARVQGKYLVEEKEISILSRTVTEMRVSVPEAWAGATLNWNGTPLAKVEAAGCWLLTETNHLQSAKACQSP
jgi:hypothetical protein